MRKPCYDILISEQVVYGGYMENKKEKKTPFRDLVNTLKEIKEKPLSDEQIEEINSIIEREVDDTEGPAPLDKVAKSAKTTEGEIWED